MGMVKVRVPSAGWRIIQKQTIQSNESSGHRLRMEIGFSIEVFLKQYGFPTDKNQGCGLRVFRPFVKRIKT